jgi:DNA-binding HxlR family transcriptional regulator
MAARTAVATLDPAEASGQASACAREECCALYHHAVELIGKRWSGAILSVLLEGPLRFSEIRALVPEISDRLLSERLKELEAEGLVDRQALDDQEGRGARARGRRAQELGARLARPLSASSPTARRASATAR